MAEQALLELEDTNIQAIDLENLILDPLNPRLPVRLHGAGEEEIIDHIARTTSIEDLMASIAEHGYFQGEPIVVCESDDSPGKYYVIEGNRRLTACRLLHAPQLCTISGNSISSISETSEANKPTSLPCVIHKDRKEVLPYLGYRHITGVKPWEPLAKARYIKQIFDYLDDTKSPKERYFETARIIGSKSNSIRRSLNTLAIYEIIENHGFYNIDGLDESTLKFAVLATAVSDEKIATFTGIYDSEEEEHRDVILDNTNIDREAIQHLTTWLFKKGEDGRAIVAESRKIRELSKVVDAPQSKAALIGGSTLEYAYRLTKGVDEDFLEHLYDAQASLAQASSMLANVDFAPDAIQVARDLHETVLMIGQNLRKKQKKTESEDVFDS